MIQVKAQCKIGGNWEITESISTEQNKPMSYMLREMMMKFVSERLGTAESMVISCRAALPKADQELQNYSSQKTVRDPYGAYTAVNMMFDSETNIAQYCEAHGF